MCVKFLTEKKNVIMNAEIYTILYCSNLFLYKMIILNVTMFFKSIRIFIKNTFIVILNKKTKCSKKLYFLTIFYFNFNS